MPQFFFHHFHTAHHHYEEYNQLFYMRSLRALASSLVSVFIPIYLLQINDNSIEKALPIIALYYMGVYSLRFLLSPVGGFLTSRIGAKHVLTISAGLSALAMFCLAYLDQYSSLLLLIVLLSGVNMALFFTALHTDMSLSTKRRKGKQVSSIEIVRKLVMAIGPLVGGVIAGTVGIYYSFIAAAVIILVSTFDFTFDKEPTRTKHPLSLKDFRNVKPKIHLLANVGMGMNLVSAVLLWPLFVYLLVGSYEGVGVVVSISLALSIFIMRFLGVHDSSRSTHKQIRLGASFTALTHAIRPVTTTLGAITGVNLANDVAYSTLVVPYMSSYYKNADQTNRIAYVSLMEMAFGLGATLTFGLVLLLTLMVSAQVAIVSGFVIGALGSLAAQLIKR